MRVILEVIKSDQEDQLGKRFAFERPEAFVVGRKENERVQFRIPSDRYFSRYHMVIEVCPPDCFIRDLGSKNGTYVNGEEVRERRLSDGDVIRGGHTEFCVRIEECEPAEVAAPEQAAPERASGPDGLGMDTTLFGRRPDLDGTGDVVCRICSTKAEDSYLKDLTQTRMLAYVCEKCCHERKDANHPIPNYEKLGVLGRGALGPVYKARRMSTDKRVALKLLSPELASHPGAVKTFLREMLLAAKLNHPRIVPVVEIGQAGGDLFIASELIEGVDARELARGRGGTLPPADAVEIVCQVLEALDYAHGLNLVHRDVKPSNILVAGSPGAYDARLADFGLLRHMDEAGMSGITLEGEVRGTVPFMPPEQVLESRYVRPAGDVYSTGATLYWLMTGEYVYDFEARDRRGERKDAYAIILDEHVPMIPVRRRNPSIPESLAGAIATALAYEPENRYETAAEMAHALRTTLP